MSLRIIDINYLNECMQFELYEVTALYRSPSQSQDLFESFKENLELNLEFAVQNNPFSVVVLGNFNTKSSNWSKNGMTTIEGKATENNSSQSGLHQVMNEPKHILEPSFSCMI